MEKITYQVLMRCPIALQWVQTGTVMDRASFESATFEGNQFGCSACRGMHSCEKKDLRLG